MIWEELKRALETLSLEGPVTLAEIRDRHRCLIKKFHPDAGGAEDGRIREINAAYRILSEYCREYRFSFTREEFLDQNPEERLRQQFANSVVWGREK
ncbi:MAG: J domain-containing protein [Deltaproteobacteria bacterium]|nr:J domain-containing protein [Deltaproteobacteria bacterium]